MLEFFCVLSRVLMACSYVYVRIENGWIRSLAECIFRSRDMNMARTCMPRSPRTVCLSRALSSICAPHLFGAGARAQFDDVSATLSVNGWVVPWLGSWMGRYMEWVFGCMGGIDG